MRLRITAIDGGVLVRIILCPELSKRYMTFAMKNCFLLSLVLGAAMASYAAEDQPKESKELFPDKALERAVRKSVYEKRDNDKPLVESDLGNISIIQASNMGISGLAGLEKCEVLA